MVTPKKVGYVIVDTANIYYQVFGNNQRTLILLHGNGEDWHVFDKQIEPFSKHFKVVTVDSRGHGSSSFGREALSIDIMADDVVAVMDELNILKAVVVGFSDGGNIAIQMALKYSNRIEKLVLAGANLNPSGVKVTSQLPVIFSYLFCKFVSTFNKGLKKRMEILGLMVNYPDFQLDDLKNICVPTLVLAGEKDMIKKEHTELIANTIPNCKLEILPKANHFIFDCEPNKVTVMIITYICYSGEM